MVTIWVVGRIIEGGWMAEAVLETEQEAKDVAYPGEFIAEIETGSRLPELATDAKKIYFPNEETWEESALYKIRNGGTDARDTGSGD